MTTHSLLILYTRVTLFADEAPGTREYDSNVIGVNGELQKHIKCKYEFYVDSKNDVKLRIPIKFTCQKLLATLSFRQESLLGPATCAGATLTSSPTSS